MLNVFQSGWTRIHHHWLWKRITVALRSYQHLVSIDFNMCLSNECELLFSSGFNLHFPDHSLDRASFHMFIDHLCFLLGKCFFVLCVFPIGLFVFFLKFLGIFCLKQNFILIPEVKTLVW